MKEVRAQTFRQMMKHDNTVRFPAAEGEKKNKKKKQINLWRGGDFKERIKPLIVHPEFRWNSSRWLEGISEKPRVRVKSRFHLQRAVAVQPDAVKKSIDRPTNRSLFFVILPPFPVLKAPRSAPCRSLSDSARFLGSRRAKITHLPWRKSQPLRNATCY